MNNAYGFLEVRGLVCGIEAADAMLKAASVRMVTHITTNPGLITLVVEGDIGSCRAAVDAGRMVAERLEALVSEKVIGRPEPDLALFFKAKQAAPLTSSPHTSFISDSNAQTANTAVPDPLAVLLDYLAPIPNGKRLDQLALVLHLPEGNAQELLNTAVQQGRLKKTGSRYLIP